MNKQANILFIPSSSLSGGPFPEDSPTKNDYYYELIHAVLARGIRNIEGNEYVFQQLASIARHAYFVRRFDVVEHASQLMLSLPASHESSTVARVYEAMCMMHQGDLDGARRLAETAAEASTKQYRARALSCIGATYCDQAMWTPPWHSISQRPRLRRDATR